VSIRQGGAGTILADSVDVSQAGAGYVKGTQVTMSQSAAGVVVADTLEAEETRAFLVIARRASGVTAVFDWRALALGCMALLLLRRLLRR
jgi:hypothetical protein